MKLAKALKEKKRLASEIAKLKSLINKKNSYLLGSDVTKKFDVRQLYGELQGKIEELVNLKIVINEANKEIQSSIFLLSEYKAMIDFLNNLNVVEGKHQIGYSEQIREYDVQIDEIKRDELVKEFQDKADSIQDIIDTYNHTIEISWNEDNSLDDE